MDEKLTQELRNLVEQVTDAPSVQRVWIAVSQMWPQLTQQEFQQAVLGLKLPRGSKPSTKRRISRKIYAELRRRLGKPQYLYAKK